MSDRIHFVDGARITEAMLNDSFGFLEQADHRIVADVGIVGVISGLVPQAQAGAAGLSLSLTAPGLAYDTLGRRIHVDVAQAVNCSRGTADMPTAVVMPGHERWLSVSIRFARHDTDPVLDKYGRTVAAHERESFAISVSHGAEAPGGCAERPAMRQDEILLCDLRLLHAQASITADTIDLSRRCDLRLWKAKHIEAQDTAWDSLPRQRSVQGALDGIDALLTEQARQLQTLVQGDTWQTLRPSHTVQEALNAVDEALSTQADAIANLVQGRSWAMLPNGQSLQATMDAIDGALTQQKSALQGLRTTLEALTRRTHPDGQRIHETVIYTKDIAVPPIPPKQSWLQATRLDALHATDRIAFVRPVSATETRRLHIVPVQCLNGAARIEFVNLTDETLELPTQAYEIAVVVPDPASDIAVPQQPPEGAQQEGNQT